MKSSGADQCVWRLVSRLDQAKITLWASTCSPSSQARVTSEKSPSSFEFPNIILMFLLDWLAVTDWPFSSQMHLVLIHGKLVWFHNPHNVALSFWPNRHKAITWLSTWSFTNLSLLGTILLFLLPLLVVHLQVRQACTARVREHDRSVANTCKY